MSKDRLEITVTGHISAKSLLKQMGAGTNERIQRMLVDECRKEMDRYVPMQSGTLKNTANTVEAGIEYQQPYARYLYYGRLMVDPKTGVAAYFDPKTGRIWSRPGVRKVLTNKPLTYHGAPMRGPFWDQRMWADKGTAICQRLAKASGGKAT